MGSHPTTATAPPRARLRPAGFVLALGVAVASLGGGAAASPAAAAGPTPVVGGAALAGAGPAWAHLPGVPAPPAVTATSYLLADVDSGDVLAAKASHVRLRPASTQKILTAITLLPQLDPSTIYRARPADAAVEGSKVGMVPNAPYTVAQLWQGLFLVSGNDAATGLANAAGGTVPTVAAMRATAHDLQAEDTTVVNVTGLDAPGQLSSAYDLALIARAGLARDDFRTLCSTVRAQFPGRTAPAGKARPTFQIYTQDRLLLNYRGAIGIKTGFTSLARNTFVGAATRNGHTLVVTLMHTGAHSWREAAALLDWGFAHEAALTRVGTLVPPRSAPSAAGGSGAAAAAAVLAHPSAARLQHAGLLAATPPWWTWLLVVLLGSVAALRTRALLRRSRRRRLSADAGLIRLDRIP